MADSTKFVQAQDFSLSGSGVSLSDTSVTIDAFQLPNNGALITMTDFGDIGYGVFEPGTDREENFSFTAITQNANNTATLTCTRGLNFVAPYTAVSGLRYGHAGNTLVRLSNTAPFYNQLTSTDNDETITGKYTFPAGSSANRPVLAADDQDATDNAQLITHGELVRTALNSAVAATTTQVGYSKLSTTSATPTAPVVVETSDTRIPTQAENDALVGTSGSPSSTNKYVTNDDTTATPTADKIVRGNGSAKINIGWENQYFNATTLNAGETINGTTTPVAVYIKGSDGEVYKTDASFQDERLQGFSGFVTNSTTDGNPATLVTDGIITIPSVTLTSTVSSYVDQQIQSSYTGGSGLFTLDATTDRIAMAFRVGELVGNISSIKIAFQNKTGSPTYVIDLYAIDSNNKPTGSILATSNPVSNPSTGVEVEFTFATPYSVTPGDSYAFVVRPTSADGSNKADVATTDSGTTNFYRFNYSDATFPTGADYCFSSTDSGGTYSATAQPLYFKVFSTQKKSSVGSPMYLSETPGEITPFPPASNFVLEAGKLLTQTSLKLDNKRVNTYLGGYNGLANTTTLYVPIGTRTILIRAEAISTETMRGDLVLKKYGKTAGTISGEVNTSSDVSFTATWSNNTLLLSGTGISSATNRVYFYAD